MAPLKCIFVLLLFWGFPSCETTQGNRERSYRSRSSLFSNDHSSKSSLGAKSNGFSRGSSCSGRKLSPGTHCNVLTDASGNSKGCFYVPSKRPAKVLLYFRGVLTPRAPGTRSLFTGAYNLDSVAQKKNQAVFATASPGMSLTRSEVDCLQKMTATRKLDVASHSGGNRGLRASAPSLRGIVDHLFMLDNFYPGATALNSAIRSIAPRSCSGFFTRHNWQRASSMVETASNGRHRFQQCSGYLAEASVGTHETFVSTCLLNKDCSRYAREGASSSSH